MKWTTTVRFLLALTVYLDDGEIDFVEFCEMMKKSKPASDRDRLYEAFVLFDEDGNGYITSEEMQ